MLLKFIVRLSHLSVSNQFHQENMREVNGQFVGQSHTHFVGILCNLAFLQHYLNYTKVQ